MRRVMSVVITGLASRRIWDYFSAIRHPECIMSQRPHCSELGVERRCLPLPPCSLLLHLQSAVLLYVRIFFKIFWFVPGVLQVVQLGYGILDLAGKSYPLEGLANGWGRLRGCKKCEWSLIVLLSLWERRENFTTAERRKTLSAFSAEVISKNWPQMRRQRIYFSALTLHIQTSALRLFDPLPSGRASCFPAN